MIQWGLVGVLNTLAAILQLPLGIYEKYISNERDSKPKSAEGYGHQAELYSYMPDESAADGYQRAVGVGSLSLFKRSAFLFAVGQYTTIYTISKDQRVPVAHLSQGKLLREIGLKKTDIFLLSSLQSSIDKGHSLYVCSLGGERISRR
jgi:hypothetical protein